MNPLKPATYFCPGRVNLIGEHIDYNGGLVLPAAISLGITASIRSIDEALVRIWSSHTSEVVELPINHITPRPGHWSDHIIGVLLELGRNGLQLRGCEVHLSSTLPQGTGLSSSAAIEVLTYYMLTHWLTGASPDRKTMALACQRAENDHIGVKCGIMDQYAVALGRKGHALLLDCAAVKHTDIPLPLSDHALLVIDSKAPRQLASSAYNQRRLECETALHEISTHRDIAFLTEAMMEEVERISDSSIRQRARHVVSEQQRVLHATEALNTGNLELFGQLINASHNSLRDDYQVSSAQLDHIVTLAQGTEGCIGARLTGAGFGGCCVALMEHGSVARFTETLQHSYRATFGLDFEVYAVDAMDGVAEQPDKY